LTAIFPDFETMELVLRGAAVGAGATVVLDLWIVLLKVTLGMPSRDWGLVGRWVGHFPRGQFVHARIAAATPVRHELALGWGFHYFVGALYGVALLVLWGSAWARQPTLGPALVVGLVSLAAPFFLMDPALGAGIAASKSPKPNAARLRSVINHVVFSVGLYASGWVAEVLSRA
jgi:hypothetical protein